MANDKLGTEREVARTIRVWDELERIQCSPDFAMRLQARIHRQTAKRVTQPWAPLARRLLLPAMLVLLLALNVITAIKAFTAIRPSGRQQADRHRMLTNFAAEYSLTQSRIDSWIVGE